MEVQILKKTINTENNETFSYNQKKMRVAAYARVSTSLDDQINSFESQVKYYKDKISKNSNWSLVNIYTDEGITGTSTKLREGFNRMIKDACEGKIDLILTKSISRFARNTVDTIKYVRALKAKNVPIIFEEEHINTMDMNGELLLTVLSSIAQQESYNIGQHVRQGRQMKIENGERVFSNKCYGFDWDRKEKILKINPKEAEVVRKVYAMYLSGESYLTICRELNMEGIKTHFGKKWETGKIRNMLTNEKYVGDVEYNKFFVKNVLDHREVLNRGEYKKVYVKNNHEGIINRKDWEKVQKIFKERQEKEKSIKRANSGKYPKYVYTSKMTCGFCGSKLNSTRTGENIKFTCKTRIAEYEDGCKHSRANRKEIIEKAFVDLLPDLISRIESDNLTPIEKVKTFYVKTLLKNYEYSKIFNSELFDKVVNYLIIGGYDKDGNPAPYTIKFILRDDDFVKYKVKNEYLIQENNFEVLLDKKLKTNFATREYIDNYRRAKQIIIDEINVQFLIDVVEDDSKYETIIFEEEKYLL